MEEIFEVYCLHLPLELIKISDERNNRWPR